MPASILRGVPVNGILEPQEMLQRWAVKGVEQRSSGQTADRVKSRVEFNGGDPRSGEEAVHFHGALDAA